MPLKTAQVVLVRSPLEPGKMVVKRITGLPGDAITVSPPPLPPPERGLSEEMREIDEYDMEKFGTL